MKEKKLISIVIPTFCRNDYLKKALYSVKNQTYKNVEVIIVDDSPQKKKKDFFDGFKTLNIRYIHNKKREGVQESRNIGIKKAKGKYIAFLDDDDTWDPRKLEKQMQVSSEKNIGLISCWMEKMQPTNKTPCFKELINKYTLGTSSTFLIKRDVFSTVGTWDKNCVAAQDHELGLRIAKSYSVYIVPEILVKRGEPDKHIGINYDKRIRGHLYLFSKFNRNFKTSQKLKFIAWISLLTVSLLLKRKDEKIMEKIADFMR